MAMYDPQIIEKYADNLYRRATLIVITCMILGLLAGIVGGASVDPAGGGGWRFVGAALGLFLGCAIGNQIVFGMKLKAQMALCQVQIEKNTHRD